MNRVPIIKKILI